MTKKNETDHKTVFFVIISLIAVMILFYTLGGGLETTGQSIGDHDRAVNYAAQPKTITASGSFGGLGDGRAKLSFSVDGGLATGTFSGDYVSGPIKAIYTGQLIGTFAGGEGGTVSGTMNGRGQILSGNRQQGWQPITGTFTGTVNFARGIVTGSWRGTDAGGVFNLRFAPIKGVPRTRAPATTPTTPSRVPQYGATTTTAPATLGYCRCRKGPSTSGIEYTPYGGSEMEFKGFTTLASCQAICPGRSSWREK